MDRIFIGKHTDIAFSLLFTRISTIHYSFVYCLMEQNERKKILVSQNIGEITVEISRLVNPKCAMVLAHGAGAGMDHLFMKQLSSELNQFGIDTVRFNFAYMEKGKKRPDVPAVAHRTIQAVIEQTQSLYNGLPVILGGKSFGGRMSSQLMASTKIESIRALIFYGFPLHPAHKPGVERADHLRDVDIPMLFLQSTRDALAYQDLIRSVCASLSNATLVEIDGADHAFKVGKKDSIVHLAKKSFDYLISQHIV